MAEVRVSVLSCLFVALAAASGYSLDFDKPQYTQQAPSYADFKEMTAEAAWYEKVWADPVAVIKGEPAPVEKYLGKTAFEASIMASSGDSYVRTEVAKALIKRAQYDPFFDSILRIAGAQYDDRITGGQAMLMLINALQQHSQRFPGIGSAAKPVLMAGLSSAHQGVRYAAIKGLGTLNGNEAPADIVEALVAQLGGDDELIISAAAEALGNLNAKSILRQLMNAFERIPEDADPTVAPDEAMTVSSLPASERPLNLARLSIAKAINRIAGLGLLLSNLEMDAVLSDYEKLAEWWKANQENYP